MAFNPIRDLSKTDRDQSVKQLGGVTQDEIVVIGDRLRTTTRLTSQLAEVIKRKNTLFKTDLEQIKTLDRRIKRVIPIIPGMTGVAGAIFGRGGGGPGDGPSLPGIPLFPPFPPRPPRPSGPPGPGPVSPPGPVGPPTGTETDIDIKIPKPEDVPIDIDKPRDRKPIEIPVEPYVAPGGDPKKPETEPGKEPKPQTVPLPGKPKEPEPDKEAEPGRDPIPLPAPPPPPIPLTPPLPRRRRKKEKEEEEELVPTRMTAYQFELALRSRRQKEKGADPAWLAPYYQYLGDFFQKNKAKRNTLDGFINPDKYPLEGAVVLPDGGILTVNPVGSPFNRRPMFKYYNGIEWSKTKRDTQRFADIMNMVQAVFAVLGPFTGARRPTTQPGKTTPTVPDPTYRPPKGEPAVPLPTPGSVIVPTAPGGGPLGRPQPVPKAQPTQRLLPAQGVTIDVTPTQSSTTRSRGITEQIFNPSGRPTRVKKFSDAYKEYSNRELLDMIKNATDVRTKKEYQKILDERMLENVLIDPNLRFEGRESNLQSLNSQIDNTDIVIVLTGTIA